MLFAVTYTGKHDSEEMEKRSLNLFKNWTPPAGFEFKAHYAFADASGGVAIVEVGSPEALLEACAPYQAFNDFEAIPIVEVSAAMPIYDKTNAWRDSVS